MKCRLPKQHRPELLLANSIRILSVKKLIETVEMIKELHQGNKLLRDNVQTVSEERNTA